MKMQSQKNHAPQLEETAPRFSRRQKPPGKPRGKRRARRILMTASGLMLCALLPSAVFYVVSYRRNLGVAREKFPPAPAFSSTERVLILSPHCDDETLGAGGAIAQARARGLRVRVVFLTNGDGSRSTQIAYDVRHMKSDSMRQLAVMRQKETILALAELGVGSRDIVFLGYPDGGTQAMWQTNWSAATLFRSAFTKASRSPYANSRTANAPYCGQSALDDVIGAMRDFRPTTVLTTHPADTHPDHWAAYAYARAALEALRLDMSTHAWAQDTRLLTFLVHHGAWPTPHGYHPDLGLTPPADLLHGDTHWMQSALDEPTRAAKTRALSRYASQLATTPQFLRAFLRRNELFGEVRVHSSKPNLKHFAPSFKAKHATNDASANDANANDVDSKNATKNGSPTGGMKTVESKAVESSAAVARAPGATSMAVVPTLVPIVEDATRDSPLRDLWPAADLESVSWRPTPDPNTFTLRVRWRSARRWPAPRPASSRWSASRGLLYRLSLHTLARVPDSRQANAQLSRAVVCEIEARSSPQARAVLRFRSGAPSRDLQLTARRIADGLEIDVPRNALERNASKFAVAAATNAAATGNVVPGQQEKPLSLLLSASTFLGQARLDQTATGTLRMSKPRE